MRLANKIALITGGNSGIGLATAKRFIEEGAKVAITGRNEKTLKEAADALGPNALAIRLDVTDVAATEKAVAEISRKLGKLDIVFANAGIAGRTPLGSTTLAQFEEVVRTNLTAVFFTVQAAFPHLNDGGSVILNGSVHAVLGLPASAAYAATKAGIRAMTRNLATDLAPRRIRVNQVTPGATKTPIWGADADVIAVVEARYAKAIPLGRLGEAEEIANAALFLASDESRNVTATEIVVDGGSTGAPSGAPIYR